MRSSIWIWAIVATTASAIALFLADLYLTGAAWDLFVLPESTVTYFCERTLLDRFIRQPGNTYTNLAYLLAGVVMIGFGFRDLRHRKGNLIRRYPVYSFLYGLNLIYLFIGSSLFHASLGFVPEWIDLSAVYAVTAIPVVYNLHRIVETTRIQSSVWAFLGLWLLWTLWSSIFTWEMKAHTAMPSLIFLTLLTLTIAELRGLSKVPWNWVIGMLVATIIGTLCFIADVKRVGCEPDGWLHPHGIWHLSAAAASACFYGYMRASDRLLPRS